MMIVSDFIEWLKTQDQGATVEVLKKESGWGCEGDIIRTVDFDPEKHVYYADMRGHKHAIGTPWENTRTLLLGEE